jgi:hypothetical protein
MDILARIMLVGTIGWYLATLLVFAVPSWRRQVEPSGIVSGFMFAFGWQFMLAAFHWGGY